MDLELDDYYWTRKDYTKAAAEVGFSVVDELLPKADKTDTSCAWISEKEFSPYVIFVFKKNIALRTVKEKIDSL